MNGKFIILLLTVVVVLAVLVVKATSSSASMVISPADLARGKHGSSASRLRMAGRVSGDEMSYTLEPRIVLSFRVINPGGTEPEYSVRVVYRGIKPDMFAPGRDVILEGNFRDGVFEASNLLTQCPSKYEPPKVVPGSSSQSAASGA